MPLRRELVMSTAKRHRDAAVLDDFLLLAAICLAGAVLSIYLSSTCEAFKDLPSLIVQYNLY